MINVNKLFPRLSIRAKLVIAFCLFGVVPVAVVGGYGAVHSFALLTAAVRDRLGAGVLLKADEIRRSLGTVRDDVRFLSRLPTLQELVNLPQDRAAARDRLVARLSDELLAFSRSRAYYQVRVIDQRGREIVRADFDGTRHFLVPGAALQDKSDRYYFREAMATPPGAIYVSPMDLNVEGGVVERPHKPVVRYAVTLRNEAGAPRGVVVVNLYASDILGRVLALGQEMGEVSLASSAGDYLSRSQWLRAPPAFAAKGELAFPPWLASYADRVGSRPSASESLADDYPPDLLTLLLAGKAGTVIEPGLGGRLVAYAPIFPREDAQGEFWVLTHTYRKAEALASIRSLQGLVLGLGLGVFVIALALGVAAARHFTRPITDLARGAEAVARGEFDPPIRVETNDELEDLARQFTGMARELQEHQAQLLEARERAERRARETEAMNRVGMEVLALLSLPKILQLVADKARELLGGDLALLCLDQPNEGLRLSAASGATEVLRLIPDEPVPVASCGRVAGADAPCPAVVARDFPSQVAVEIRSGGRVVGNLCVAFREPRPVSTEGLEFLTGLANQAAIAIENARLHGEIRDLARLEERERIAEDLHDGIIQSIYATGLGLEECTRLAEESPQEVGPRLERAIEALNGVIRDVRNYVVGLQPGELRERGLSGALADLARGLALNALLHADLDLASGIDERLTPDQTHHLFHICREALTNVVKHAQASRVRLSLQLTEGALRLSVEDDGTGFEPDRGPAPGRGLHNVADRVRRLGGSLHIESARGQGTRLVVEAPVEVTA